MVRPRSWSTVSGHGRSATIVVADRIALTRIEKEELKGLDEPAIKKMLEEEIKFVKQKRPQINLNEDQKATIVKYIQYLVQD